MARDVKRVISRQLGRSKRRNRVDHDPGFDSGIWFI
jgi:hypothetical protein